MKTVLLKKDGRILLNDVSVADSFFPRFRGLMFRKSLPSNSGLHIVPCNQIHMFNMKFPIDVIYLDKQMKTVHIDSDVQPGKICPVVREAHSVLEINSGCAEKMGITIGDLLEFEIKTGVTVE